MAISSTHKSNPSIGAIIDVEMGEIRISTCLTDTLMAYGLGACVGVCVYDPVLRVAGLAHVVLPEQRKFSTGSGKGRPESPTGKFADTAIPFLVNEICRHGGEATNLRATIAGGAHIFSHSALDGTPISRLEIGLRNVAAVTDALARHGITLYATDVGGCHGRTVQLRVNDGLVTVCPIGAEETTLAVLGRDRENGTFTF
jgi:chemotaxis protein CheD